MAKKLNLRPRGTDMRHGIVYELQFGFWGFRLNGGALYSYPTKSEAIDAWLWFNGY